MVVISAVKRADLWRRRSQTDQPVRFYRALDLCEHCDTNSFRLTRKVVDGKEHYGWTKTQKDKLHPRKFGHQVLVHGPFELPDDVARHVSWKEMARAGLFDLVRT